MGVGEVAKKSEEGSVYALTPQRRHTSIVGRRAAHNLDLQPKS